jgi:hypothetical protein
MLLLLLLLLRRALFRNDYVSFGAWSAFYARRPLLARKRRREE